MKMKRKTLHIFIFASLLIIGCMCFDKSKNSLHAANNAFPSITMQQYSRLQLSDQKVFTALDTNGNFLADYNSTSTKILKYTFQHRKTGKIVMICPVSISLL